MLRIQDNISYAINHIQVFIQCQKKYLHFSHAFEMILLVYYQDYQIFLSFYPLAIAKYLYQIAAIQQRSNKVYIQNSICQIFNHNIRQS